MVLKESKSKSVSSFIYNETQLHKFNWNVLTTILSCFSHFSQKWDEKKSSSGYKTFVKSDKTFLFLIAFIGSSCKKYNRWWYVRKVWTVGFLTCNYFFLRIDRIILVGRIKKVKHFWIRLRWKIRIIFEGKLKWASCLSLSLVWIRTITVKRFKSQGGATESHKSLLFFLSQEEFKTLLTTKSFSTTRLETVKHY